MNKEIVEDYTKFITGIIGTNKCRYGIYKCVCSSSLHTGMDGCDIR